MIDATPTAVRARPHFPGLEGLRAIAAGLVVLTHAAFLAGDGASGVFAAPARYGDIGVSIFFVLSGFLIYRPFVVAHLDGRSPLPTRAFWWRRVLRIFPAYWVALTFFWGMHHFSPFGFSMGFELGRHWWKYYLLLQIYDPTLGQGGIAQSWSVATEISFYLLIPFLSLGLRALARNRPSTLRRELTMCGALFTFAYLSRWWFSHSSILMLPKSDFLPDGVSLRAVSFTWLPNQLDLFAIGMAVAVVHSWAVREGRLDDFSRFFRLPTLWWGVALAAFLAAVYGIGRPPAIGYKSMPWQLRQIVYGVVGLTLLLPLVFGDLRRGLVRRFVNWKPIWWAGTVSYAFYLWHLTLMERMLTIPSFMGPAKWHGIFGWRLAHASLPGLMVGGFAAGLIAAGFSWYLLEKPLLRFKGVVGGRQANRPDDQPIPVNGEP